jgi:hypothetical protein
VAPGQVSSEYFHFSYQFSFHLLVHTHHLLPETGTIGQIVADVPNGPRLSLPYEIIKIKKCCRLGGGRFAEKS